MTKSDSIRAVLAKPRQIHAALAKRKIRVSVALVNAVKYGKGKKRDPLADLRAARSFVRKLDGIPLASDRECLGGRCSRIRQRRAC